MQLHRFAIVFLSLCIVEDTAAQWQNEEDKRKSKNSWMLSGYVDWGIATRAFARNLDRNHGFGIGGDLLASLQSNSPVWVGAGVHSFAFDSDRITYSQEFGGILYNFSERTTSRVFMAHGLVRFQPPVRFILQPYLQGGAGVHWFFTNTKIRDTDAGENTERINENRKAVLGYMVQAGIQYVPPRLPELRAEIRAGYFRNASVEYMRYNPTLGAGIPAENFERRISAVDMLGIHIGVAFLLQPYKDVFSESR